MSDVHITDDMTIGEARPLLRQMAEDKGGCRCALCGQHAQVYRWSLYANAAYLLMRMYRVGGTTDWVESKTVKAYGQQAGASELRHWNLVEPGGKRPDGGKSGWWRVTELGEEFVLMKATIQKYVDVYDGVASEPYGPEVWITDCLGRKFDYDKMMRGEFGEDD